MKDFEPKIVCFLCKWCTYSGADLAGTSRMKYPPNGVVIKTLCSSRVDPQHVLLAFSEGCDGVFIGGCHPGDCHYQSGNYKTKRRVILLKKVLEQLWSESQSPSTRVDICKTKGKKIRKHHERIYRPYQKLGPIPKIDCS